MSGVFLIIFLDAEHPRRKNVRRFFITFFYAGHLRRTVRRDGRVGRGEWCMSLTNPNSYHPQKEKWKKRTFNIYNIYIINTEILCLQTKTVLYLFIAFFKYGYIFDIYKST